MAKKNTRVKKSILNSTTPGGSSPISSLPDDLLEQIAFELKSDRKFASLAALDQTCKRFSSVCKPILWQNVVLRNASHGTRLFSKKTTPLRALVGYVYIDTEDNGWFWKALGALSPKSKSRYTMVHAAFPNVKMRAERALVWPKDQVVVTGDDDKIPEPADNIRIWISVCNHASDAINTLKTMDKVIAAILEFSDFQYSNVHDYADDIISLPAFATKYDPDGDAMDREVFMEFTRRVSQQSALISRMPPDLVESTYAGIFDAHKAGTLSSYPPALKPHFHMLMNEMVKRTDSEGCLLRMEEIGTVALHMLLENDSPDLKYDAVAVTYKLFLTAQSPVLDRDESRMLWTNDIRCKLLESHASDSLHQIIDPSSVMVIDLHEDFSPTKLFANVWERMQTQFLDHLDRFPVMGTTDLPQKLVVTANYDERINGVPVVEMDFATAESRRMTVVGILDDDDGMSNKRFYRDGQLVKLSREE